MFRCLGFRGLGTKNRKIGEEQKEDEARPNKKKVEKKKKQKKIRSSRPGPK